MPSRNIATLLNVRFDEEQVLQIDNHNRNPALTRIAFLVRRFGHVNSHQLTWALMTKYGLKAISLHNVDSSDSYHSCVLINDEYTLDAYGLRTLEETIAFYNNVAEGEGFISGETLIAHEVDSNWIHDNVKIAVGDTPDSVLRRAAPLFKCAKIDLDQLITGELVGSITKAA
jgi:hypothetical protein